ncbi:MAG: ParB N-terminal domain-containing protein, partial [Pseudomonadota bacterium]|nr:ParB N-terminal domain-containing protein [Pseudomonadota bacterium]
MRNPLTAVPLAFEAATLRIAVNDILPLRETPEAVRKSIKYAQIAASIGEIGIIEPPVVVRDRKDPERYHLLDGHLRLDILRDRGDAEVVCLVATEDEAFTYNKRVSRIAIIQEHKMILNAVNK